MKKSAITLGLCWLLGLAQPGCNSGSSDGLGGAGGEGPSVPGAACKRDADCDDFVRCNGAEFCDEGVCRYGTPVRCDDGVSCTVDRCIEATGMCESSGPDEDGDGHIAANCQDAEGEALGDDCDDTDELRFPGNAEICDPDFRDEDCDTTTLGFRDSDNDGVIDALCCNEQEDGELACEEDCDDFRPNVNPNATEACDFFDNDCDGEVDEKVSVSLYPDADKDGHGDASAKTQKTCAGAVGFSADNIDCDDADPEVFLGQFEICDGKDNNCDPEKLADEIEEQAPWFPDSDEDTYGDPTRSPVWSCYRVAGRVLSHNDCNDENKKVNPNAPEVCDALDNDCNGIADYRLSGVNDFEDDDQDHSADAACGGEDCDDRDARTSGGAEEVCDHVDNDCDGEVDEQTTQNIWYIDEDGDGWGVVIGSALASCDPLPARARQFGDCDDSETGNGIHPGSTEYCDGVDNDCDGSVDEGASAFCNVPNAVGTCKGGTCQVFACQAGFADLDGEAENGCEGAFVPTLTTTVCQGDFDCNDGNICNGLERCSSPQPPDQFRYCLQGNPVNCAAGSGVIDGDVVIEDGRDIHDLTEIEFISGSVTIENTTLSTLVGLESLKNIGGDLVIRGNSNLTKLSGSALSNLETVGGTIYIENNPVLLSADLPSLLSAKGIHILNNATLTKLVGYANLVSLEDLKIQNNPLLIAIEAFNNLTRIGGLGAPYCPDGCAPCLQGGLVLSSYGYDAQLSDLSGFENLTEVGGDLCLLNLGGNVTLPKLKKVGMTMRTISNAYYGNDAQSETGTESLSFPVLESVGNLDAELGGALLSSVTFPKLKSAAGEVDVSLYTYALETLDLAALKTVSWLRVQSAQSSVKTLNFPALTDASEVDVYLDGGVVESVTFDALESVDALYIGTSSSTGEGCQKLKLVSAKELTNAPTLTVSFGAPAYAYGPAALERVLFPKLVTGSPRLASYAPLSNVREIDFGALTTAESLTINFPFRPVADSPGLDLSSLTRVGVADNTGPLTLCTGVFDQQSGLYENNSCELVSELFAAGYAGTPDTCGQCLGN